MFNNNYNNMASMFKNTREITAPVSQGKTYNVRIEDIAQKGDGIARIEGYVIFVPNTRSGEEVTVKIERVLPKYAFASVVSSAPAESEDSSLEASSASDASSETESETENTEF